MGEGGIGEGDYEVDVPIRVVVFEHDTESMEIF
jgi:hypothetical protein